VPAGEELVEEVPGLAPELAVPEDIPHPEEHSEPTEATAKLEDEPVAGEETTRLEDEPIMTEEETAKLENEPADIEDTSLKEGTEEDAGN